MKKFCLFLCLIFVLFSCNNDTYVNRKYKYSIKIPQNYIAINDKSNSEQALSMINRIKSEGGLPIYEQADCSLYNQKSCGPVFDTITISTLTKSFSIKQLEQSQDMLDAMFIAQLATRYQNVRLTDSKFVSYSFGKALRCDFTFDYGNQSCFGSTVIFTTNILYSSMISLVCPLSNKLECEKTFNDVVNSFKKKY